MLNCDSGEQSQLTLRILLYGKTEGGLVHESVKIKEWKIMGVSDESFEFLFVFHTFTLVIT